MTKTENQNVPAILWRFHWTLENSPRYANAKNITIWCLFTIACPAQETNMVTLVMRSPAQALVADSPATNYSVPPRARLEHFIDNSSQWAPVLIWIILLDQRCERIGLQMFSKHRILRTHRKYWLGCVRCSAFEEVNLECVF